jgi:hypothetical protein
VIRQYRKLVPRLTYVCPIVRGRRNTWLWCDLSGSSQTSHGMSRQMGFLSLKRQFERRITNIRASRQHRASGEGPIRFAESYVHSPGAE